MTAQISRPRHFGGKSPMAEGRWRFLTKGEGCQNARLNRVGCVGCVWFTYKERN